MADQATQCRAAFQGRCDVYLHTWDALEKAQEYGHRGTLHGNRCLKSCKSQRSLSNRSSWPCVAQLRSIISPVSVAVERQEHERREEDARAFGAETLKNFRMNTASMLSGVRLMTRYAKTMGREYAAAVRMRADYGGMRRSEFREQFLTSDGWMRIRQRADDACLRRAKRTANRLELCDKPRSRRVDFCFWSSPVGPLIRAVEALEDELSGNATSEARCQSYLNALRVAVFSENILFCAMHRAGVAGTVVTDDRKFVPV